MKARPNAQPINESVELSRLSRRRNLQSPALSASREAFTSGFAGNDQ